MAKMMVEAPAKAGTEEILAALVAASGAQVRAEAETSLRRLQSKLEEIATGHEAAAKEEAVLGGLTQDQLEKLVLGEKALRQLAQSLRDRLTAHQAASAIEGAELKELRDALEQACRLGLTAGHPAVKAAEGRISVLEVAKANRIQGIREVLRKAHGVIRGLRALPISGGWKPAEGPVAELVAAVQAAAKQAAKAKAEEKAGARKGQSYSSGLAPKGAMEVAFKRAS